MPRVRAGRRSAARTCGRCDEPPRCGRVGAGRRSVGGPAAVSSGRVRQGGGVASRPGWLSVPHGRLALVPGTTPSSPATPSRPRTVARLTLAQARRVALAAQGFGVPRPSGPVTMRHVQRVVDTVGVLQIDSVNVLSRSHYVPLFSRLGPYSARAARPGLRHRAPQARGVLGARGVVRPPATHRLLRFRMANAHEDAWGGMVRTARERAVLLDAVLAEVDARGPLTAAAGRARTRRRTGRGRRRAGAGTGRTPSGPSSSSSGAGELTSAGRTQQFERRYDLPERVLPRARRERPRPRPGCRAP